MKFMYNIAQLPYHKKKLKKKNKKEAQENM